MLYFVELSDGNMVETRDEQRYVAILDQYGPEVVSHVAMPLENAVEAGLADRADLEAMHDVIDDVFAFEAATRQ